MNQSISDRILHACTFVLLTVIVGGGMALAYPSWRRGQALRDQSADLRLRIDAKKREIAMLVENQRRFRTDADFVESIARRNRRVFPGELVFMFDD